VNAFIRRLKEKSKGRPKHERVLSEARERRVGTLSLGKMDKVEDGLQTRRDRREIIVIK